MLENTMLEKTWYDTYQLYENITLKTTKETKCMPLETTLWTNKKYLIIAYEGNCSEFRFKFSQESMKMAEL